MHRLALVAKRIAALLGLIVFTLAFAEIFVRLVAPQALMPRYVTGAPWGVRRNIPNADYWHVTPDVKVEYRINRWGMRDDRDFTLAKPPGVCRVALLGDSYTVGYELTLQQTFAHRLEAMLRPRYGHVQVLNFGVSGFGTAESLRTYEAFARNFRPDLVVMQWQVTDYDDNIRSGLYRLKDGQLVTAAKTYLPGVSIQDRLMRFRLYRLAADHSHLYNFAREWLGWRLKQLTATLRKRAVDANASDDEVENGNYMVSPVQAKLSGALLLKAKAEAQADGAGFLVADIPNRPGRRPDRFTTSYDLIPAADRAQMIAASPIPQFVEAADRGAKLFYTHGARHLTPIGADLMAQAILRQIQQNDLLATCKVAPGGTKRP